MTTPEDEYRKLKYFSYLLAPTWFQPKATEKMRLTRDLWSVKLVLAQRININAIAITIYHFLMESFQMLWQSYQFYGCCR